jgi:hypothetical protein
MFRELFNFPVVINHAPAPAHDLERAPARAQAPSSITEVQREGAFITVQSLVSFPGATAAVTGLVNVVAWAVPAWRARPPLLFVIAAGLVGLTIYLINESDPLKPPAAGKQRLIAITIAAFNTFVILSASVGADAMFHSTSAESAVVQPLEVNHG